MSYDIHFTEHAIGDLEDIYDYIYLNDVPGKADLVVDKIELAINELSEFPNRGVHPGELIEVGIKEFREVFFKPYRIIYRITGNSIYIMLIIDGRRNMQTLLYRRLIDL
ncbi:MAG: type II toxin-antitoxin system RelE/ParE family toxin [Proteobacteria bacterium]|nr:type II toxin-antitoxin system RelE/ParE family toxin [Pseudomonadota bacterium]